MSVFLRVDINIIAMLLLCIVIIIAFQRLDRHDELNKLYLRMSMIIVLQLFFESATCLTNGQTAPALTGISVILHICLFITAPVLTYTWYTFIRNLVGSGKPAVKKWDMILLIPVAVNTVLTLLSPFFDFVFYIDAANVYHRGPLFFVSSAITYVYLLAGLVRILRKRRIIVKQEFIPLVAFGVLPMIGGLIQSLFYGVLLMWSCTAFSLMIVYIYLQQRMVHLDNLTGAWDRHSFDFYISKRAVKSHKEPFGMIYFDVDGLKNINDIYGHNEGDFAIRTATQIVKSAIRKKDIVARLGGDEFIIILDCESGGALEETIRRIEASFEDYNRHSAKSYKIWCSFGADIFDPDTRSIDQFLEHVDSLMYASKKQKKEAAAG